MPTSKPKASGPSCREVLSSCACFNLRKASRSVTQLYDEMLQPTGLRSTQVVLLTVLAASDDGLSLNRLARELVTSPSTASRTLQPLKREGLIESKRQGPRGINIRLSSKGAQALREALPYWEKAQARFVELVGQKSWIDLNDKLARTLAATRQI